MSKEIVLFKNFDAAQAFRVKNFYSQRSCKGCNIADAMRRRNREAHREVVSANSGRRGRGGSGQTTDNGRSEQQRIREGLTDSLIHLSSLCNAARLGDDCPQVVIRGRVQHPDADILSIINKAGIVRAFPFIREKLANK